MLVVVAVNAEVFPVGAVRRVVVMVAILVMNGQEMPVLVFELPPAFCADEAVYPEGPLPIIFRRALRLLQFPYYFFH